jgi:hypothetical protein
MLERQRTRARRTGVGTAAAVLLAAWATNLQAADHQDGPATSNYPDADITDLFAFPAPTADGSPPSRLVLAMTLHRDVAADTAFSDALVYRFRIRRGGLAGRGADLRAGTDPASEVQISCTFGLPDPSSGYQEMTCVAAPGPTPELPEGAGCDGGCPQGSVRVGELAEMAGQPMRLFAGRRADPFFSDVLAVRVPWLPRDPKPSNGNGRNTFDDENVLAIVVELDIQAVLGGAADFSRFAVAAETLAMPSEAVTP